MGHQYSKQYIEELIRKCNLAEIIQSETGVRLTPNSDGFNCLCPFHREKTPSFQIYNSNKQSFICFGAGCGVKGDVLSFLMKWKNISFLEAIEYARNIVKMPKPNPTPNSFKNPPETSPINPRKLRTWESNPISSSVPLPEVGKPVTVFNPKKKQSYNNIPTYVHVYRNTKGEPLLLVLRFNKKNGGKYFFQVQWKPGGNNYLPGIKGSWTQYNFPADQARPLYGLQDFPEWLRAQGKYILIVEGEKTRDAVARMLPVNQTGIITLTNLGSTAAVNKVDWNPFVKVMIETSSTNREITIILWPDADKELIMANGNVVDRQKKFISLWKDAIHEAFKNNQVQVKTYMRRIIPGPDKPSGWDLADAYEEGWGQEQFLQYYYSQSELVCSFQP